mmetsp:Transcript_15354/g.29319  ORF Transcript_15354/g.29319 Transcript_15354/m.29319 type:complete len:179 (+) Transcript_15354:598-1134(+)
MQRGHVFPGTNEETIEFIGRLFFVDKARVALGVGALKEKEKRVTIGKVSRLRRDHSQDKEDGNCTRESRSKVSTLRVYQLRQGKRLYKYKKNQPPVRKIFSIVVPHFMMMLRKEGRPKRPCSSNKTQNHRGSWERQLRRQNPPTPMNGPYSGSFELDPGGGGLRGGVEGRLSGHCMVP